MKRKLFICGGHVTPAIALIDELSKDKSLEVVFVGRKSAAEYTLVTQKGIRFLPLTTGKLHRTLTFRTFLSLFFVPLGFIQACLHLTRERPDLVVSFGGYVALPVSIAAWILRIPVITHEQTLTAGLANTLIEKVAKRVCVSFEESLRHFPEGKAVYTGLPLRKEIFLASKQPAYPVDKEYPLIYITGGSQGAKSLNEKIFPAIAGLTKSYTVIHQTGKQTFPKSGRYIPEPFIPVTKLSWILSHARIVIGRSGANTTVELAALGQVAVLVPLPWSAGNEQLLHARWLADHGSAVVLEQDRLTPGLLANELKAIEANFDGLKKRAEKFSKSIPRDGAKRLAEEIYRVWR